MFPPAPQFLSVALPIMVMILNLERIPGGGIVMVPAAGAEFRSAQIIANLGRRAGTDGQGKAFVLSPGEIWAGL